MRFPSRKENQNGWQLAVSPLLWSIWQEKKLLHFLKLKQEKEAVFYGHYWIFPFTLSLYEKRTFKPDPSFYFSHSSQLGRCWKIVWLGFFRFAVKFINLCKLLGSLSLWLAFVYDWFWWAYNILYSFLLSIGNLVHIRISSSHNDILFCFSLEKMIKLLQKRDSRSYLELPNRTKCMTNKKHKQYSIKKNKLEKWAIFIYLLSEITHSGRFYEK